MRFPKHAFPVRTIFRHCLLVNFAVDPTELASALPANLEPDVLNGEAFLSIVVGRMERMRPVGLPRFAGITYDQIVYRAVVRAAGERGVHFLRSDASSPIMTAFGNRMSFFRFHHSDIRFTNQSGALDLDVVTGTQPSADIHATFQTSATSRQLPTNSAFSRLEDAKTWLVELYAAFDYSQGNDWIDVVRIRRGDWDVSVVDDTRCQYDFMHAGSPFTTARLDSIFDVGDVPYHWNRLEKIPLPRVAT